MLTFKVRQNKEGYFIGSDDDGSHRVTPYLEKPPKVGVFTLLESPIKHPFELETLFATAFTIMLPINRIRTAEMIFTPY